MKENTLIIETPISKMQTNDKTFDEKNSLELINIMSDWKFMKQTLGLHELEHKDKFIKKIKKMIPVFISSDNNDKELKKNLKISTIQVLKKKKLSLSKINKDNDSMIDKTSKLVEIPPLNLKLIKDPQKISNVFNEIISERTFITDRFFNEENQKLEKIDNLKEEEISEKVKNLKKSVFPGTNKKNYIVSNQNSYFTNTKFFNLISKFEAIKGNKKMFDEISQHCYNIYGVKSPKLEDILSIQNSNNPLLKQSKSDPKLQSFFKTQLKNISATNLKINSKKIFLKNITDKSLNKELADIKHLNLTKNNYLDYTCNKHNIIQTNSTIKLDSYRSVPNQNYNETSIKICSHDTQNVLSNRECTKNIMNGLQDSFVKTQNLLNTFSKKSEIDRDKINILYLKYFSNGGDLYENGQMRHMAYESLSNFKNKGSFIYGSTKGSYYASQGKL